MIVELLIGGVTSIVLASLGLVAKENSDKNKYDKKALELEEQFLKLQKEEVDSNEPKKYPREEDFPLKEGACGALSICPFCGDCQSENPCNGNVVKSFLDKNDTIALKAIINKSNNKIRGPSTSFCIKIKSEYYLYQACTGCFAEWITQSKYMEKKEGKKK